MDESLNNILDGVSDLSDALYIHFNKPKEGSQSIRSHLNKDGKPKIRFTTREQANQQAVYLAKECDAQTPYHCPHCNGWHTGHNHNSLSYYQLGKCVLGAVQLAFTLRALFRK